MALTINGTTGIETNTDTGRLKVGTGDDLEIYHDGSDSFIENSTGDLYLRNKSGNDDKDVVIQAKSGEHSIICRDDGSVDLYYDGNKKLWTRTDGIEVTGKGVFSNHIYLPDDVKLILGNNPDLEIKHESNLSTIKNTHANGLAIRSDIVMLQNDAGDHDYLTTANELGVKLYYDNNEKLETTESGIKVSGLTRISSTALDPDNDPFDANDYPFVVQNPEDTNGDSTGIGFAVTTASNKVGAAIHHVREGGGSQGDMRFLTSSDGNSITERLRILSTGVVQVMSNKLCIGTSVTDGGTSDGTFVVEFASNSQNALKLRDTHNAGSTTYATMIGGSTAVGSITGTTGACSFNNLSDYRSKENDVKITDGITKLKLLRPIRFNYKHDSDTLYDGFFAHEVTPAVPSAVTGDKDAVDSEGKIDPQMLDVAKIVPLLTAALQEAITKIETLETKVAALEAA